MSGPKDYTFTFIADRLAEIRRRNEQIQQARAVKVQAQIRNAVVNAAQARAAEGRGRSEQIEAGLAATAAERKAMLRQVNADAQSRLSDAAMAREAAPMDRSPQAAAESQQAVAAEARSQADREQNAAVLRGWAAALSDDAAVTTFADAERAEWTRRADALAAAASASDFSGAAHFLAAEAADLHHRAGDLQARFDVRNELLADVIASMKEMGYFVSDPYFADPADPASPAILKATCGSEQITTSVDLSSMVKSVWDGQEHEHCKSGFFDFMDAMKARGVALEPERPDLRERPVLKQKDANELPRSTDASQKAGA